MAAAPMSTPVISQPQFTAMNEPQCFYNESISFLSCRRMGHKEQAGDGTWNHCLCLHHVGQATGHGGNLCQPPLPFSYLLLNGESACCRVFLFVCLFVFVFLLFRTASHMEVPRLGVQSELQLPAYATATAMPDPYPTEQGQGSNPKPRGS